MPRCAVKGCNNDTRYRESSLPSQGYNDETEMQRRSVSSFPFIVPSPSQNSEDNKPSVVELLNPRRDSVSCSGLSVQLHTRFSGLSEDKIRNPPRKVSLSYKSLLTAPPQVKRRMSTPCSPISYTRSSVDKATDDGTSNTTTTEQDDGNLNDTGSKIPANDDTSKQDLTKLPKIVLPRTPRQNGKSRKNKKQRKKFENKELEVESDDTPSELDEKMADSEESGKSSVDTSTPSLDSEADMDSWKYRLEAKHFQLVPLGWDMTKPYTYSYFPKIESKKRKKKAKVAKKGHGHVTGHGTLR